MEQNTGDYLEQLRQQAKQTQKTADPICPNCGYCPHCGRGGQRFYPWVTPVPYYPQAPYWTVTTGGTGTIS